MRVSQSRRHHRAFAALLILSFLSFPAPSWSASQRTQFIRFEVWVELSPVQRKNLADSIHAIKISRKKSTRFRSSVPSTFLKKLDLALSFLIPEAQAYSQSDKIQYAQLEREWNNKCGPVTGGNPSHPDCGKISQDMIHYEKLFASGKLRNSSNRSKSLAASTPSKAKEASYNETAANQASPITMENSGGPPPNASNPAPQYQSLNEGPAGSTSGSTTQQQERSVGQEEPTSETPGDDHSQLTAGQGSGTSPGPQDSAKNASPAFPSFKELNDQSKAKTEITHPSESSKGAKLGKVDRKEGGMGYLRDQGELDGPCAVSKKLGHESNCEGTKDFIETSKLVTQGGMMALGMGTQLVGMNAANKAQKSGSMSEAMSGAADAQKITGMGQMGMGAVAVAMGVGNYMNGRSHSNNAEKIEGALVKDFSKKDLAIQDGSTANTGADLGDHGFVAARAQEGDRAEMVNKVLMPGEDFGNINGMYQLNYVMSEEEYIEQKRLLQGKPGAQAAIAKMDAEYEKAKADRNSQAEQKAGKVAQEVKTIGRKGAEEQNNVASAAKQAAFANTMLGLTQMIGGYANMKAAELNKDSAKKIAALPNTPSWNFAPLPGQGINPGDALAPGNPSAISPGPSDGSGATGEEQDPDKADFSLGDPIANQDPSGLANPAPPPPSFKVGDAGGGGSGGGGGGLGGGSTSPASGTGDENPGPRLADGRGAPAYEGGGAAYRGGGGGGGGDKGPDLSGLLSQFLPKNGDEAGNKNGILDYGGGRGPAGVDESGSLLDRNINIFERVHQAYQEKQMKKRVGI